MAAAHSKKKSSFPTHPYDADDAGEHGEEVHQPVKAGEVDASRDGHGVLATADARSRRRRLGHIRERHAREHRSSDHRSQLKPRVVAGWDGQLYGRVDGPSGDAAVALAQIASSAPASASRERASRVDAEDGALRAWSLMSSTPEEGGTKESRQWHDHRTLPSKCDCVIAWNAARVSAKLGLFHF